MKTGRAAIRPRAPAKVDNMEVISVIQKIAITGSAAYKRGRSEVIQTVKIMDQVTAALRGEGFHL